MPPSTQHSGGYCTLHYIFDVVRNFVVAVAEETNFLNGERRRKMRMREEGWTSRQTDRQRGREGKQ